MDWRLQQIHQRFQSTRPVRGATTNNANPTCYRAISIHAPRTGRDLLDDINISWMIYFNPRAPCGARPTMRLAMPATSNISIHAPRAGRDRERHPHGRRLQWISIHAPRAGRDFIYEGRRARDKDFNPRAPCGARPGVWEPSRSTVQISIHAPRAGRDN